MATTTTAAPADARTSGKSESQAAIIWRRFRRHRIAMFCLGLLAVMLVLSALAPVIAPFERDVPVLNATYVPPFTTDANGDLRVLGTDNLGRDFFTRILYASRVSLVTAIVAAVVSSAIGVTLGLMAGYFGGWVDNLISRFLELIATFPQLLVLLILANILVRSDQTVPLPAFITSFMSSILAVSDREARQVAMVIVVLSVLSWTGTARLMRGMVLQVREQLYIESSRALGASPFRIIRKHVFPNALPPLIVDFTLGVNALLVAESALSFLGFGIQEPTPTWGNLLNLAQDFMLRHPWMPLIPSLPILLCSIAINYIGDGLRDALDPRQKI
jgi:peptide/nickel transport system permease protein